VHGRRLPGAVEVFEGNTADPLTLAAQIDKLKQRFKLQRVVMVGDRGLLTSARIEQTLRPAGLDWITACGLRRSSSSRRRRAVAALAVR
jgi:Transposase